MEPSSLSIPSNQSLPDHVLGCSSTSTVSNSRRPNHISMVAISIDGSLSAAHVPVGPNAPRAGPVFPSSDIDTESTSVRFSDGSRKDRMRIDAVTKIIHEASIPRTIQIFLSSMICWLNRIATTLRGWMILTTSLLANSKAIRILMTLRPPPVEPALAPTIMSRSKTNWLNTG